MTLWFAGTGWQPPAKQGASENPGADRGICTSWQVHRPKPDNASLLGQPLGASPQKCQAMHCRPQHAR